MHLYKDYISHLSPHDQFDPRAFQANGNVTKDMCAFFLALSLIYNDLKFLSTLINLTSEPLPKDAKKREIGELAGIKLYIMRLNVALIFELFNLINKNRDVLKDKFFIDILKSMEPMVKKCWEDIVFASDEKNDYQASKIDLAPEICANGFVV